MTEVQNNDLGSVDLYDTVYDDLTLKFAAAETWEAGTVLQYDSADSTYVLYVPGNAAAAVLRDAVTSEAAGNIPQRGIVEGQVRRERLVVNGVGAVTEDDVVSLRQTGIVALPVNELGTLDNQS